MVGKLLQSTARNTVLQTYPKEANNFLARIGTVLSTQPVTVRRLVYEPGYKYFRGTS